MAEPVTKTDLAATRDDVQQSFALLKKAIDHQTLVLTVRLGGMVAVAIAILAAIVKLA